MTAKATFREYAQAFSTALNLYPETPDELVSAARAENLDAELREWLQPECHHPKGTCDHAFPEWFIQESGAKRLAAIMRRFKPENV